MKCCVCRQTFRGAEIMHLRLLAVAPLCLGCQRKKLEGVPLAITDPEVLRRLREWAEAHPDLGEYVVRDADGRVLAYVPASRPTKES